MDYLEKHLRDNNKYDHKQFQEHQLISKNQAQVKTLSEHMEDMGPKNK